MITRLLALLGLTCTVLASVWAQAPAATQSIVGTWLVTVEGIADNETRTLIVTSEAGAAATADLAARYGLTSKGKTPVEARLIQNRTPRQLVVITQAASTITVDELPDGSFAGTFVAKDGKRHPVKLARVTEAQAASTQAINQASPCASFEGRWSGTWVQGGMGQAWLWVQAPAANCTVRFAYVTEDREPRGWASGRIQDGVLRFTCNTSTGGVCNFKQVGDELWVSYSGSMGTNSAVFKRVAR